MKHPIDSEQRENLLVFRLSGELNSYNLDALKHELSKKVREAKIYRVLINLAQVEYVTSKDLGVFVQVFHFLQKERKENEVFDEPVLAFCNLEPFVQDVMAMTRLETIFRVFDTEEEAIEALSKHFEPPPSRLDSE